MSSRRWHRLSCAAILLILFSAPARGEMVYDSGVTLNSDTSFLFLLSSDEATDSQIAAQFALDAPAVVNHIQWSGTYGPLEVPSQETFAVRFFEYADGLPGADLGAASMVTPAAPTLVGTTPFGDYMYSYSAHIAGTELDANRWYFLSIVNQTPGSTGWSWLGGLASGVGTFERSTAGDSIGEWERTRGFGDPIADFSLGNVTVAAVPEPTSLATLAFCIAIGCGGAGRIRSRRQQQRVA